MADNTFQFLIECEDKILVIVKAGTKSVNQLQNITDMYEDYCISNRVHARLEIKIVPLGHTHQYADDVFQYPVDLKIDRITGIKEIENWYTCIMK